VTARPFWFWCVFPALTMSLGWGLRGSIGGGPLGAMIPGAMIGLALCLLLGREQDAGRIAAFAALGVGFGGQETYGQTVGLSLHPETFRWAILGFGIKGAVWGLLGGALIGAALARVDAKRIAIGLALMVLGTWIGWKLIDDPKLLYFSNRLDKPREEVWAGLTLGGLFLLGWLRDRVTAWFALAGAIGGGIGFAFGASLQPWGKGVWPAMPLGWWKGMEFSFGALLGLAFGVCAWRLRHAFPRLKGRPAASRPLLAIVMAAAAIALTLLAEERLPVRFGYTIGAAALAALVLYSETLAWQTAITATYAAFALDSAPWLWAAVSTPIVAVAVAKWPRVRGLFLLLTWTAVASSFRHGVREAPVVAAFVLLAIAVTITLNAHQTPTPD
jgi:hypothetical protein